jgi:LysM repeat protein
MKKTYRHLSTLIYIGIAAIALFCLQGCASTQNSQNPCTAPGAHIRPLSAEELETSTQELYTKAPLTHENIFHPTHRKNLSGTYIVQKGDTIYGISRKFNTSVASIVSTNNLSDKTKIRTGTILKIPQSSYAG